MNLLKESSCSITFMTKELWQTWCMRRTENPENVVRIHKVSQEGGQIRLTSNGITSVFELFSSARTP